MNECPRRWYITYANNKPKQSEAMRRGTEIHKSMEQKILNDVAARRIREGSKTETNP